jgi:hypothetical protein
MEIMDEIDLYSCNEMLVIINEEKKKSNADIHNPCALGRNANNKVAT